MTGRLTYAIPVDVARQFDSTVSQSIIDADTFQNSPDDVDLIASMIEDAESEFNDDTDSAMKIGRRGVQGQRETYEELSYEFSGHNHYKRNFSGVWTDYTPTEKTILLDRDRVRFDATEGDELYVYRGLTGDTSADSWEDITDKKGDLWDIRNNPEGELVFHPLEIYRSVIGTRQGTAVNGPSQQEEVRFAITYRYGGLGGGRTSTARTTLDEDITDSQTGSVSVTDGTVFPTSGGSGAIPVLVGREYLLVDPDPQNDQMTIEDRGVRGSDNTAHSSGDRIQYTPGTVRKGVAARAAMQLVRTGRYSEWLPDAEDSIDKSEVMDDLNNVYTDAVDAVV